MSNEVFSFELFNQVKTINKIRCKQAKLEAHLILKLLFGNQVYKQISNDRNGIFFKLSILETDADVV